MHAACTACLVINVIPEAKENNVALILGIDPGLEGGLALVSANTSRYQARQIIDAIDIPIVGVDAKKRVNVLEIIAWLTKWGAPDHAFIERAGAMPRQGGASGFKYGRAVGTLETFPVMLDIPMSIIEASAWKAAAGLKGKTQYKNPNDAKEAARQRILQLHPKQAHLFARKMDHGRAEAALIAIYGYKLGS